MTDENTTASRIVDRTVHGVTSMSREDLVLSAVPALFVPALIAGAMLPVSFHVALAAAAIAAAGVIADAVFVNPPTRAGRDE